MNKYYILLIQLVVIVSGCKAGNIGFKAMESAEEKFNKRQAEERVIYMPLERLFSDPQVRSLAKAAGQGDVQTIEKLVEQGVDVNHQGAKGATPLFWSLKNINGFEKLLQLGADPNIIFDGSSVMHWSARNKETIFLEKALLYGGDLELKAGKLQQTPIFETIGVVGSGNQPALFILLDAGANINAVTGKIKMFDTPMGGKTPVMIAADLARFDIVYILLKRGANYDLKDDAGRSLLDRALSKQGRFPPSSPQKEYLNKVISFIENKDIN